jgi:probable addiction module antidote protein
MNIKTRRYDVVSYLETDRDMAGYLEVVMEDSDPVLTRLALGNIARAKGIRDISKQTGIPLKELLRAFCTDDAPKSSTVKKLVQALGAKRASEPVASVEPKTVTGVNWDAKKAKRKAL